MPFLLEEKPAYTLKKSKTQNSVQDVIGEDFDLEVIYIDKNVSTT